MIYTELKEIIKKLLDDQLKLKYISKKEYNKLLKLCHH